MSKRLWAVLIALLMLVAVQTTVTVVTLVSLNHAVGSVVDNSKVVQNLGSLFAPTPGATDTPTEK